jgi:hypothetical protein
MALELVADYRSLHPLVRMEIHREICEPWYNGEFEELSYVNAVEAVELSWVAECIELSTLLSIEKPRPSFAVLRVMQRIDRNNVLRNRLFRLVTACGYSHVPESELRVEIRPTGLYLISS